MLNRIIFFKMIHILIAHFNGSFFMRISAKGVFFLIFLLLTVGAELSILPASGQSSQEKYSCFKREHEINIDGNLADWASLNPIQLRWKWQVKGTDWKGPEDLSALCWLTWDEEKLYFAFDIWDDFTQSLLPTQKPWQGEGVLLTLKFPKKENKSNIRNRDFNSLFLAFALSEERGIGVKIIDSGRGFYLQDLIELELIVIKKKSGEGTLYEGAVPWASLLPKGCEKPDTIKANIIINDIDKSPAKKKSLHWALSPEEEPNVLSYKPVKLLTRESALSVSEVADTPTRYYRKVPLVLLNVTVMDQNNNYILDLEKDEFMIYEDAELQEIAYFDRTERPITMAILLDTSGSMVEKLETAQKAAVKFVESSLCLQDQALVMEFNSKPTVLQDFTNDVEVISQAIKKTKSFGGTALYDALYLTMERLRFLKETKAIVLLSDGRDEAYIGPGPGSRRTLADVVNLAKKTDAIIYSIGLGYSDAKASYVLQRLADYSGGRCYFPREASDLNSVYSKVGEDLRSQYIIGYYPKDLRFDGRWRTIRIDMKNKNLIAKTRKGYYAHKK